MKTRSGSWHDYYDQDICRKVNVEPLGKFIYVGVATEPQYKWDADEGSYTKEVEGQGYWVIQDFVDENGEHWFQNPILVIVSGKDAKKLELGKEIVFVGMAGYYSRKKHSYSFRADSVKEVTK